MTFAAAAASSTRAAPRAAPTAPRHLAAPAHRPMPAAAPPLAVAVPYERIGDLLVREGLITREQLANAQREQKQSGTSVDVQPGQARLHPGNRADQDAGPAVPDAGRRPLEVRGRPQDRQADPDRSGDEEPRAAAQARRPDADRRHRRPDQPRRSSTTSSSSRGTTSSRSSRASSRSATRSRSTTSRPTAQMQSLLDDIATEAKAISRSWSTKDDEAERRRAGRGSR